MKNLIWIFFFVSTFAFSQSNDTTFYEYLNYADSAHAEDATSLKAYRWYIKLILITNQENPDSAYIPYMARVYEVTASMSYDFGLYNYARIFYERSLAFYRAMGDEDGVVDVIPKIALSYRAMREQNLNLKPVESEEQETAEVYYRIVSQPVLKDGKIYVKINGGISDGLYANSVGYAFAVFKENMAGRANTKLGNASIYSLDTNSAILEVIPVAEQDSFHTVYTGDMVQMLSLIPKREFKSIFWELALNQIIFMNQDKDPMYDYRMLLKYDSEELERELLEITQRDIYTTWIWLRDLEDRSEFENIFVDKASRGRFKGFSVYEAMEKTTTDDILAFLGFVKSYPSKYMGIPYKINETYATWLLNECYIGFDEFMALLLKAEKDADYKKLVDEYFDEITEDEFFVRVNMYAEDYAELKDIESALSINARAVKLAEFIDDESYLGWAFFNKGRIYDYDENEDSTVFYYQKAIPYFERSGDFMGKAFCQNNLASIYEDRGDYQLANEYYRYAYAAKRKLHNEEGTDASNNFYSMSKSNSGIGNTEYLLANYDSAIVAYKRGMAYADSAESLEGKVYAVSLLTDMTRIYKKRGQYGEASELYKEQVERNKQLGKPAKVADAFDNLADVLFSKGDYKEALEMYYDAAEIKIGLEDYSGAGFSYSNCGQALWNLGDLDSAIVLHTKAIEYRELGNDAKGVAYAYSKIGELFKELGEAEKAATYYGYSIATYYDYGDSLKVAELSIDLGDLYEKLKNFTKSLEYYEKALNMYTARGMKSDAAYVESYIGYVYFQLQDYTKAEGLYRKALSIRREINERQSIMYSLVDLSSIMLYAKYNYDTSLVLLNEAMLLAKETESKDYEAYCHEFIGNAYYFRAETKKAEANFKTAYDLYVENGNVTGQTNMLLNLGANELQKGEFTAAFDLYQKSLTLSREKGLSSQVARTYTYLAEYYYYTGEFQKAFEVIDSSYVLYTDLSNEYGIANTHIVDGNTHNLIGNASASFKQYQIADSIYNKLKDPLSRATAINNMGTIKFFQGDYNEALRLFGRCRHILDSVNVKSGLLSTVTGNIGEVYMEKGIWEESNSWLQEAIAFAEEIGATRDVWGHKTNYAKLLYKQGKYEESIAILEQCYASFLKSDEKMAIAEIATNLGKANQELGKLKEARDYYNEAIGLYKAIGSKKMIWEPLYKLALVEQEEDNTLASVSLLREAVDTLENLSSDIVGSNSNKKLFAKANDKKNIYQSLITQMVESGDVKGAWAYQEKLNMYGLEEQTRGEPTRGAADANGEEFELASLELKVDGIYSQLMTEKAKPANQRSEEKIKELEKRMSVASSDYQNFFWDLVDNGVITNDFSNTINPEDLDQMRLDLDPDVIVLEYLVTDEQLIIFTASADTLGARVIDITRESLESFVNRYYNLLVFEESEEPVIEASQQLYNVLIEPIKPLLNDKKKLAIIPTGILFKLPFQSLGKSEGDKMNYLIQDYEVFYLNDIRSTMNQVAMNVAGATLIAFGNADSSLIFAEKEVDMISEKFPEAVVYVKSAAREDLAKTTMNDYQIVHFATHGNLDPINFNNSYLTMAPNMEAGEDGRLTMNEINRIRTLRGCQLIVLSACNTAVNDEKLEGWVNNPAKAFLRKGAKSAIASLWSVDDAATGLLMQYFYQNLKDGQNKSEALNNAQKKLVTSTEFSHPYYWAAFELMGQWM